MKETDYKNTARTVGVLYVIGTVAGVLSTQFPGAKNAPDYLTQIAENPNDLVVGAILTLVMGFALALIPAFMFPILRKHSEAAGVGYIIFRGGLETCGYIISAVCYLALSSLGAAYTAGTREAAQLLGAGAALNAIADSSVGAFAFGIGALVFYNALYKYRLIPRWLSGFGLAAIMLHIVSGTLVLFGLQEPFDKGSMIMNLPIAVQEMIMAVWLIAKGFALQKTEE